MKNPKSGLVNMLKNNLDNERIKFKELRNKYQIIVRKNELLRKEIRELKSKEIMNDR
jgi:hypothetical protein